ncbi:MAG: hypothetical protein HY754_02815 [Nitrospirae bacterium]|nr:hypothetical protein [Nitrospirota bacterium]
MKFRSIKEYILPPEPILSLILIGFLILSGIVYYRAVKIQRFLEPALAVSQPRSEFTRNINKLLVKEFGLEAVRGVKFSMGSIFIEESLLFDKDNRLKESAYSMLKKLGNVFISALSSKNTRLHIDLILINARFPVDSSEELNNRQRLRMQLVADLILDSMYRESPELEKNYSTYFAATAMPVSPPEKGTSDFVEFRIIPSELIHIGLIQRLHKYVQ